MGQRPGLESFIDAVEEVVESREQCIVVFEAPTGYGKTRVGPDLYKRLSPKVPRIIHSLPLRAIVQEAYDNYRRSLPSTPTGYQAHGLPLAGKAPFFRARAIVTTMDSFALNLFKSSVAERGLGHYEVVRAHILSSLVVFDEAHLSFRDRKGPAISMIAMLHTLSRMRVPTAVETATLPRRVLRYLDSYVGARVKAIVVSPPGNRCRGAGLEPSSRVEVHSVEDRDYYEWAESLRWDFQHLKGLEHAVEKAVDLASQGLRVFLASTKVEDAIEAYNRLATNTGEDRVSIIHGRLTVRDRRVNLEKAENASIVVGTSAVEAGVNLDVDAVITDIPVVSHGSVAWDSLFQRMGRACRSPSRCRDADVPVYLYGDKSFNVANTLTLLNVNPRIPCTYMDLLDEGFGDLEIKGQLADQVKIAFKHSVHREIERMLESLCNNPYRGDLLVPIVVPPDGDPLNVDSIRESLESEEYLVASLTQIKRNRDSWLARDKGGFLALVEKISSYRGHPDREDLRLESVRPEDLKCGKLVRKGAIALVAKPGAYIRGVGLK